MRISTRMSIALAAAGFVVFGLYGVYNLESERENRRQANERNIHLLGRSLQLAIENALRDRQMEDIRETMEILRGIDPTVDIMVWGQSGQVFASSDGSLSTDSHESEIREWVRTHRQVELKYIQDATPPRILLGLPLAMPDGRPAGELLLNRPLTHLQRDLEAARRSIALSVLFFVVFTTTVGHLLGTVYIGRPLARMAIAMQRVRSGDLTQTLPADTRDEVGALAGEFNAMVEQLREARQQLEEETEQKHRLERGLQEAGKLIAIGQLSAGLAHEIGSPLQILNGRARALLTRAHDPETTRKNAEILVSQTDRITHIVEQLLQFARRRPARLARFDLLTTARAVVQLLEIEARRRRITLTIKGEEGLPPLFGDPDQVQQIVLNLLTNALVATPAGGQVSLRIEPSMLQGPDSGEVQAQRLIIADTGCGVDAELIPRLWEPFFTTRATEGGTGLGLAVVKSIVNAHRGTVSVESTPGQGSRFIVDLPLNQPSDTMESRHVRSNGQEAHPGGG